jgi:hypothetical protein
MTKGVKAGALLALALGCSTRRIALELREESGHGGHGGSGMSGRPGTGGTGGHRGAPVAFDGNETPGAPYLQAGDPSLLGGPPQALAIADLDGDGWPDLVTANAGAAGAATVSVLLNLGGCVFAPRADTPIKAGSTSIAIGDVNGDGRPDVAVGGDGGLGVEILLNTGGGHLQSFALCGCGGGVPVVALADLDGDGLTDIIVANRRGIDPNANGDVVVQLNDEDDLFKAPLAHYGPGLEAVSVAVGDVNGDGQRDVVVAGAAAGGVLLNAGAGRLADPVRYETVRGVIALGDIDGDGRLDLVDAEYSNWTVDVLLNGGGGGVFAAPLPNAVQKPVQAAIGDLDGDGRVDLVIAKEPGNRALSVLLNDSGAQFKTSLEYAPDVADGYRAIALGDLDGDGKLDIAAAGGMKVTVFRNGQRQMP